MPYFDERPSCFRNFLHELLFLIVVSCSQLLTQAALGNVLLPLRIIGPDIGIEEDSRLPWTLAAYSLTAGVFILITGRFGDIYGHRLLLIIGYSIFSVSSVLVGFGGFVENDIYFNIMRGCQGIGPATLLPNAVALLARAYPKGKRKSFVFAMFGATAPSGFLLGGLFGSLFGQFAWWPWAQWSLAIFCAILAVSTFVIVPAKLSPAVHPTGKADILGAVAGVTGLSLFIYCWNQGPAAGWDQPYVYAVLSGSIIIISAFLFIEMKAKEPIMPPSIWSVKGFPGVLACIALGWSSFGIYMFFLVQIFIVLREETPLLTTALLSPLVIFGIAATILVSLLYSRIPGHFLLMASMFFFCSGNVLIATVPPDQTYWGEIFVSTVVVPFGVDISYPAASLIISNSVPIEQQGVAASMLNTVINWSVALGLGIAGTVESERLRRGAMILQGYRSALYAGIGLSGAGFFVAIFFCRVPDKSRTDEQKSSLDAEPAIPLPDIVINTSSTSAEQPTGPLVMTDRY